MSKKKLGLFLVSFFAFASFLVVTPNVFAETSTTQSQPIIHTEKTANGSTVYISFPQNYNGKVVTTYDGNNFTTTTTPLTWGEIIQMQNEVKAEQQRMNQIFEEQQKLFDDMWKNFSLF